MMYRFTSRALAYSLLTILVILPDTHGQEKDLAKLPPHLTPVPYAGVRNYHLTRNLGPTGARGWIEGDRGHIRESREILIRSIEQGSPADGVLRPYDIILGAAVPPNTPASSWTASQL